MEQPASTQNLDNSTLTRLSALLDGECSLAETAALTRQWPQDTELQAHWHAYHLIGDTLRSDDLGGQGHDAAFLHRLRLRLADEPVILAPAPMEPTARRVRWRVPVSAAAGVLALAGSAWMLPGLRPSATHPTPPSYQALATPPVPPAQRSADQVVGSTSTQFNPYLSAHQRFQSAAAIAPVSGYMRHADFDATAR